MSRADLLIGKPLAPALPLSVLPTPGAFSAAVTVTGDGATNTKGAWSELIAATAADANWIAVTFNNSATSTADNGQLLDIGIGAAASEVVLIADMPTGYVNNIPTNSATPSPIPTYLFPVSVTKGTRVAARVQGATASDTISVTCAALDAPGLRSPRLLDTIGATTASSRGTNLPTTDTYAEVTAATTQAYQALILLPCAGSSTLTTSENTVTLAIGASGSEVALGTVNAQAGGSEAFCVRGTLPPIFARHIPRGTRIAVKSSTGRTFLDVIVIGVPYA